MLAGSWFRLKAIFSGKMLTGCIPSVQGLGWALGEWETGGKRPGRQVLLAQQLVF